jgi:hypothetical protein
MSGLRRVGSAGSDQRRREALGPVPQALGLRGAQTRAALRTLTLATLLLALFPFGVRADSSALTFTQESEFRFALEALAAAGEISEVKTLDFEDWPTDWLLPSGTNLDGVSLTYTIGARQLQVRSELGTTSPVRYLGLDTPDGALVSGDSVTLSFDGTVHALGLFVMGETQTFAAGDFELRTNAGGLVRNVATPDRPLDDGEAFFLGIIDGAGFGQAELESFDAGGSGLFVYDVDDVTTAVPEPAGALPLVCALLGLGAYLAARGRHQ